MRLDEACWYLRERIEELKIQIKETDSLGDHIRLTNELEAISKAWAVCDAIVASALKDK